MMNLTVKKVGTNLEEKEMTMKVVEEVMIEDEIIGKTGMCISSYVIYLLNKGVTYIVILCKFYS